MPDVITYYQDDKLQVTGDYIRMGNGIYLLSKLRAIDVSSTRWTSYLFIGLGVISLIQALDMALVRHEYFLLVPALIWAILVPLNVWQLIKRKHTYTLKLLGLWGDQELWRSITLYRTRDEALVRKVAEAIKIAQQAANTTEQHEPNALLC
jgi:uncharacterized membrane protein (DUF2068 family)